MNADAAMRDAMMLHRDLVSIPSVSHEEGEIARHLESFLGERGARVERIGDNVVAVAGDGPRLLLNTHFDTVPPGEGWSRDPWDVHRRDGRVYGLGSNDAKASVAAMTVAFLRVLELGGPCEVMLMLVCEEETGGQGVELAWPQVRARGWIPEGVVVGEPTGLNIAVAQKGLLILELECRGDGGHSANAAATGATNALFELARDLVALETLELGPVHPFLGASTLQPTQAQGGEARNSVPTRAGCLLDLRTVPGVGHAELVARVRRAVAGGVRVVSDRLEPRECPPGEAIARAARRAGPGARIFGSATMSDLVHFRGLPGIKCGPGQSERSHTPDEFVLESEIQDGVRFYGALIDAFATHHRAGR